MQWLRWTLLTAMVVLTCALTRGLAEEANDEMVDNPLYKGWSSFNPGSRAVVKEVTVHADGSTDEKEIIYRLDRVTPKLAVVHTSVIERDLLSRIETAPTRIIYPAKVSQADLKAAVLELDARKGKDTLKVLGKELECTTYDLTEKKGSEEIKVKVWRSSTVPGGVVKRIRTTNQDGKLVATTTTTLTSYRVAEKSDIKDSAKDKRK